MTLPPLSAPPVQADAYLIVCVGAEQYAIAGAAVREVARWRSPTPVPGAPPVLPGIISQRGVVVPIVDLRLLLGLPAAPPDRATRLVLCQHDTVALALLVDSADDLAPISSDELARPPAGLDPRRARMLAAVTSRSDKPLAVLDLPALILAVQEGL